MRALPGTGTGSFAQQEVLLLVFIGLKCLKKTRRMQGFQVVKVAYWCNRLAFYLYCASMPLMGKVYNPEPAAPDLEGWSLYIQSVHHLVLGHSTLKEEDLHKP